MPPASAAAATGKPWKHFTEISVPLTLFSYNINIILGPREHVVEYIAWKFDDSAFSCDMRYVLGRSFVRERYAPVIWLPRAPLTPREHGTFAHEVFHAICAICQWAGIGLNGGSEEFFCHAIGYVVTEGLEGMKRKRK